MSKPTSDEKTLAALAHASVLLSFFGPIGATLIWVTQRTKSKYVRFHALQAMGYQVFSFWAFFIGIFVIIFSVIPLTILLEFVATDSRNMPIAPFILQPIIFLGIVGLMAGLFLYGLAGAVSCMLDRDFSYLIIGSWLRKRLLGEQVTDAEFVEHEDNWVSGICHATTILRFIGLLTPLILWFSQKERSLKIRFQSLQAVFYQGIAILVGILTYVVTAVFYFSFIAGMIITGVSQQQSSAEAEVSPVFGMLLLIFMVLMMLFWLMSIIVVPLYYVLSIIASIATIRGRDYKYPLLGRIVANRLALADKKEIVAP